MFDDFVETTHELADKARTVCRLAARPSGKLSSLARHDFVNELLDAAADADGNLTLNKRSERGSLIEALDLLSPYLPAEFTKGLSFSTLFRLRHTWGQNRRKKLKTLAV